MNRHSISSQEDGLLFVPTSQLHRSPSRPEEVGIPLQYVKSAVLPPPLNSDLITSATPRARPQKSKISGPRAVKIACLSCRKASKKCSESRPCERCTERGIEHMCVDAPSAKGKKAVAGSHTATAEAVPGAYAKQETHRSLTPALDHHLTWPVDPAWTGTGLPIEGTVVAPGNNWYTYQTALYPSIDPTYRLPISTHLFGGVEYNGSATEMAFAGPSDAISSYAHESSHAMQRGLTEDWMKPYDDSGSVDAARPVG